MRVRVTMFCTAALWHRLGRSPRLPVDTVGAGVDLHRRDRVCQIWFFGQGLLVADVFPRNSAATIAGLLGAVGASGGL